MRLKLALIAAALGVLASSQIGYAQSLREKLIGSYDLVEGSEVFSDGKKVVPWAKGSLTLGRAGRATFFVLPKERAKTDSVRTPAGPMVAWYGAYTVDEAANTVTVTLVGASSPMFEGATRVQKVTFSGDTMTMTGSTVTTPEGPITPVNVWRKLPNK
jgi:hypothetical protein